MAYGGRSRRGCQRHCKAKAISYTTHDNRGEPTMTDELDFYTHPMSRGRIVRWMLEEVGQPYRTVSLDYGTTMKAPAYRAIKPDGQGAGPLSRRHRGNRNGRNLRLSG